MRQYWLWPFLALIAASAHAQTGYENSTQPWGNTNGTISWNLKNNQNPSNTRIGNCKWRYTFGQDGSERYTLSFHNVDTSYPDGKFAPPRVGERMVQEITDGSTSVAQTESTLKSQRNGKSLSFTYFVPIYGASTTEQTYTWDGQDMAATTTATGTRCFAGQLRRGEHPVDDQQRWRDDTEHDQPTCSAAFEVRLHPDTECYVEL